MQKLEMKSRNVVGSNVEKIKALFPHCVTEKKGENGQIELAVDFEKLQLELSDDIIGESEERYQFTWPDKRKAIREANTRTTSTLRPCREESVDFNNTQNLYIEGDNLEVLKVLRETYLGKVKMIYIDPPYNTGNDFVYNDDFAQSKEDYEKSSGMFDKEGNQTLDSFQRNVESNGRFHTDWLNMMYPRLKVARDLLTDDGVIFISIDDNEIENLRKICDEIFGESNLVAPFIWEKTQHFGRQKLNSYSNNEYILCYAKNIFNGSLKELLVETIKTELQDAPLYNASNNINTLSFPAGSTKFNMKDGIYSKTTSADYELCTPVEVKDGKNVNEFQLRFRSRWSNQTVQQEYSKGTTFWVKTETFAIRAIYGGNRLSTDAPRQIIFTNSSNPMCTKSRFGERVDTSENASNALNNLLGTALFSYPKPVSLIAYLCSILYDRGMKSFENDFLVLDFFSGSATTAHAVMKLNAEDGGKRKFIMVQLPEKTDEKSEAYKAGYENICEIGKERIRMAGKKVKEEAGLEGQNLDTGFRVLKLASSNMKDVFYTPADFDSSKLFEDNLKEDRTSEDLLFQAMLELGVELSSKIELKKIGGKDVWFVDDTYLVACFDDDVNEDTIAEIAKTNPVYFVMRDASMSSDCVADNFEQIFKHYSKGTETRTL